MRKIVFFILMCIGLSVNAQVIPGVVSSSYLQTTGGGVSVTDNFESYTAGTQVGIHTLTSNWTSQVGAVYIWNQSSNNFIYNGSTGNESRIVRSESFTNNHRAKITVLTGSTAYAGVICRSTGNTFYVYYCNNNNRMIDRVINGTNTNIYSYYGTVANGSTLELRVSGTTISCYFNGALDTNLVAGGSFTDSNISSGKPGVFFYGSADFALDNFEAADL